MATPHPPGSGAEVAIGASRRRAERRGGLGIVGGRGRRLGGEGEPGATHGAAGTARGAEPAGTEAKDCGEENAHGPSGIAGQAGARERPSGDEPAVDWAAGAAADEAVPHLVLLGTGAAAPSKLRSCSGVLLSVPCGEGGASRGGSAPWARLPCMALLDCGEGCIAPGNGSMLDDTRKAAELLVDDILARRVAS